jgi:capsular exopolysaccharide synthesis family protein
MKNATLEMNQLAQYVGLKREAKTNADLYNSLYTRVKEAGIAAGAKSSNIRIIDHARLPRTPSRPRPVRNIALALLLGMLGGVLGAFVKASLNTTLDTPEDIKRCAEFSSVSLLPRMQLPTPNGHRMLDFLQRAQEQPLLPIRSVFEEPSSAAADAIIDLQTSVMLSNGEQPSQVLLVTSPFPKEGKTTVAVNLAIALARHAATCLVDADMRHPKVHSAFGLPSDPGLGDLLTGSASLNQVLLSCPGVANLHLIPGGRTLENPAALLLSKRMREVVRILRNLNEYLVIDSPPLIPYPDGRIISSLVDGVIIIGRSGSTPRQAVTRSTEILAGLRAPVLAFVLNAVDPNTRGYCYYR